jgi:flagellar biosynthesis protein FlhF
VGLRQEIQEIRRQLGTKQTEARIQDQVRVDPESEGPEDVELLRHMGISKSAARQLVEQCPAEGLKPRGEGNGLRRCEQVLAQGLWAKDWMAESKGWPKRLALVGPTGVGKTTTIAKLAARFLKDHGRGLLLVTMDNYRVAAAEQLRVYAQIMNVPLEVVNTPEQMQATLKRHGDKRLTLIDSAGRSPWDEPGITELKDFLGDSQVFDKHLVLSATTSDQDLEAVIDRFGQVDISGLIFTKLDETREYASLVNAQFHVDCPLTYLSNGQRVPEDLFPADPAGLSELITSVQKEDNHDGQ